MTELRSFLFENKSTGQTIAKNTFWLSVSHLLGRVIKAGLLIFAARILGAEEYGVFSYVLSISVLFSIFADIGIGALLTRNTAKSEETNKSLLATSLAIKLFLILISSLAIIYLVPVFTKIDGVVPLLPLIAALIAIDGLRDLVLAINRAKEKMEIEAGLHVLTNIFIVSVGVLALINFSTSKALLFAYVTGSAIGLIATLFVLGKHLTKIWDAFDKNLVTKIIRDAWPFALLGLLGVVMINTDIVMLGFFRDAAEIGLYSAAQKPIQVIYVIPAIIAAAFLPTATKLIHKDNERLKKLLEQTISTTLLIGIPLALGGIVVGRKLIHLFFGDPYLAAAIPFQILLVTVVIVFPSVVIANTIFAYNEQRNFIKLLLLGTLGNILLNFLLIPKYGIVGSAFATIGAEISANTFIWRKMKKINHFRVLPHLKKIITASVLMTALTIFMQYIGVNLILNIFLSAAFYFTALKLLKEPLLDNIKSLIISSQK